MSRSLLTPSAEPPPYNFADDLLNSAERALKGEIAMTNDDILKLLARAGEQPNLDTGRSARRDRLLKAAEGIPHAAQIVSEVVKSIQAPLRAPAPSEEMCSISPATRKQLRDEAERAFARVRNEIFAAMQERLLNNFQKLDPLSFPPFKALPKELRQRIADILRRQQQQHEIRSLDEATDAMFAALQPLRAGVSQSKISKGGDHRAVVSRCHPLQYVCSVARDIRMITANTSPDSRYAPHW